MEHFAQVPPPQNDPACPPSFVLILVVLLYVLVKNRAFFLYDIFKLVNAENQQHIIFQKAHEEHFIRDHPMGYL